MAKQLILSSAGGGDTGEARLQADPSYLTIEGNFDGETVTLTVTSSETGSDIPVADNEFTSAISNPISWKKGGLIKLSVSNGGGSPSITAYLES